VGEHWSKPEKRGVWVTGDGAELVLGIVGGGHRVMILDCATSQGKRRVTVLGLEINGVDCGMVELEEGWRHYRIRLPEEAVRPGTNRILFRLAGQGDKPGPQESLLLRRFGLFVDGEIGDAAMGRLPAVTVDPAAETVFFRATGRLELPFTVDERVDALQFRYRFSSDSGHADVVVSRPQGTGAGRDAEIRRSLSAAARAKGRVRIPLHGRRGEFVLRISADLDRQPTRLNITTLRLVKEMSRRPTRPATENGNGLGLGEPAPGFSRRQPG